MRCVKYDDAIRFRIAKEDRRAIQKRARKYKMNEAELVREIILNWLSRKVPLRVSIKNGKVNTRWEKR